MLVHRHLLVWSHVFANDPDPLVLNLQRVVLRIGDEWVERLCPSGGNSQDDGHAKHTHVSSPLDEWV
jgi:hypothetical protein